MQNISSCKSSSNKNNNNTSNNKRIAKQINTFYIDGFHFESKMCDTKNASIPLGGIHFVEKLSHEDKLRIDKRLTEQEHVLVYQRNCYKDKPSFGASFKNTLKQDHLGDFKITQTNPWSYLTRNTSKKGNKSALNHREITEMINNKTKPMKTYQPNKVRSLSQLENEIQQLIRARFHSVNKFFSFIDSTHTETLNRDQFINLMEKLDFPMNQQEAHLVWQDFKEDTIKFSNFLRRFFLPKEFDSIRHLREKIDLDKRIRDTEKENIDLNELKYRSVTSFNESKPKRERELKEMLLGKLRTVMLQNWRQVKQEFLDVDVDSMAFVTNAKAIDVLKKYATALSYQELESLCLNFNLEHKSSKFDYIGFMINFKTEYPDNSYASIPKWTNVYSLLQKIIKKLREIFKEKKYNVSQLHKDIILLRNTFKRFDLELKGHLTSKQFKEMLRFTDAKADQEDIYQLQAEFDTQMNGNFDYQLLMKQLISKSF